MGHRCHRTSVTGRWTGSLRTTCPQTRPKWEKDTFEKPASWYTAAEVGMEPDLAEPNIPVTGPRGWAGRMMYRGCVS
jgi:hypothetical protein